MNEILVKSLSDLTGTNNWFAILPEIMLALIALCLLGAEMVLPRARQRSAAAMIAIWGQVIVLVGILFCRRMT